MTSFGCGACCDDDAEAAWRHLSSRADGDPPIVRESHFSAQIVRCRDCGQAFIRLFTEFIDWNGGDDPQYVTLMPVTGEEAAAFTDGSVSVFDAGPLGAGRRHLNSDWPSGTERRLRWADGPFMVSEGG